MPIAGACPYYRYEKGGVTHCECGQLQFPDRLVRREVLYAYCASPTGFAACPFKVALDHYYERSFQNEYQDRGRASGKA